MKKLSNYLALGIKTLWLVLAVLLVLFAVLLSGLRVALPHLEQQKSYIEDYLSQRYAVNLSIGELKADWQKTGPTMVLKEVSLQQSASSPIGLDVQSIDIELDFWRSVWQQQLASNQFILSGLELKVDTDRLGQGDGSQPSIQNALTSLFLEQLEHFLVTDSTVTITRNETTQVVDVTSLKWLNQGQHHQGAGAFQVRELATNSASFQIDLTGTKDTLTGVLYAKAEDMDISPWAGALIETRRPLKESRANLEVWAEVDNSQFSAFFARFDDSRLEWGGQDEVSVSTGIRGGSLQALPVNNRWQLRLDELIIESNEQRLVTDLVGQVNAGGEVILNTMKPTPVNPFLVLLPLFTSDTADDDVRDLDPKGQLATLQLQLRATGMAMTAKLIDVSWQQHGNIPGVDSIDVGIHWSKNQGVVNVFARDGVIHADNLLPDNLVLNDLRAKIYVYRAPEDQQKASGWVVSYDDLGLDTDQFSLSQSLRLDTSTSELSLATQVQGMPLKQASKLFPAPLMGQNTSDYLTKALAGAGDIAQASILWHGQPRHFPFNDNQGVFQAAVELQQADFLFADDWPGLNQADIKLWFENDSLTMTSPAARLNGIDVTNLQARIPHLAKGAHLLIEAQGAGTGKQLTTLMVNSGLQSSLGMVLDKHVQVSGPVQASLDLDIPLDGGNVVASGSAMLQGNNVHIASVGLTLDKARGEVRFINENINTDGLTGRLFGQPVTLDVTGGMDNEAYQVDIGVTGDWQVQPLLARLNPEFNDYVSGHSPWQGNVTLQLPDSGFSYSASIQSELTGIRSTLPAPLAKSAENTTRLALTSQGDEQASTLHGKLGQEVIFDGILPHAQLQFSRAHLALGNSNFDGLGMGFSISASLPEISANQWYDTVRLLLNDSAEELKQPAAGSGAAAGSGPEAARLPLFGVPERLFIQTPSLQLAGQQFDRVDITAKQNNLNWDIKVDATQLKAQVALYEDWLEQGIKIEADYINLSKWQNAEAPTQAAATPAPGNRPESASDFHTASFPPVYFHCKECILLNRPLGEITLNVDRSEAGMHIQQLQVNSDHGLLKASGQWHSANNHTQLTGTLDSNNIGALLADLGIESGIKDSGASMKFNLGWPQSPMDFDLATLAGGIQWRLSDGYLSELSDQGSRIFTLFSLNSLVRKLSLDFRDVFAEGFFYDDMRGTLSVHQGIAATSDTVIDGGAGEIEIKGYTDLLAQQLNYNVGFTPNVTGNLPVLVYFLATPTTALAALALDQMLTSAKVISNVNYKVTGTWDKPKFEEVGRDSKDIKLPAPADEATNSEDVDALPELEPLILEERHGKSGRRSDDL